MAIVWQTHPDLAAALRAVDALVAAGLRREDLRVLAGCPRRDGRQAGRFADARRDLICVLERGGEAAHVSGERVVRRLLREARLDDAEIERLIRDLDAGYAVVVAERAQPPLGDDGAA